MKNKIEILSPRGAHAPSRAVAGAPAGHALDTEPVAGEGARSHTRGRVCSPLLLAFFILHSTFCVGFAAVPGTSIQVPVIDQTGVPVTNCPVVLTMPVDGASAITNFVIRRSVTNTTDYLGLTTFSNVPPGNYVITVYATARGSATSVSISTNVCLTNFVAVTTGTNVVWTTWAAAITATTNGLQAMIDATTNGLVTLTALQTNTVTTNLTAALQLSTNTVTTNLAALVQLSTNNLVDSTSVQQVSNKVFKLSGLDGGAATNLTLVTAAVFAGTSITGKVIQLTNGMIIWATNSPAPVTWYLAGAIETYVGGVRMMWVSANNVYLKNPLIAGLATDSAIISDGTGILTNSPTTSTELGYLAGATGNVQSNLNLKALASGFANTDGMVSGSNRFAGFVGYDEGNITSLVGGAGGNVITLVSNAVINLSGPAAAWSLDGLAPVWDGNTIIFRNASAYAATLKHESGVAGTAAQRLHTGTGADVGIYPGESFALRYAAGLSRWYLLWPRLPAAVGLSTNVQYSVAGSFTNTLYFTNGILGRITTP